MSINHETLKHTLLFRAYKEVANIDQISTAIHASLQEYSNDPKILGWVRSDSLIEFKYDKFEYLTSFLKKTISYTDNTTQIPVSQLEYFKKYADMYINGVSEKKNANIYYNFSNILQYAGIIEDIIVPSTEEHIFKMTKKGFEYYKYIIVNDL